MNLRFKAEFGSGGAQPMQSGQVVESVLAFNRRPVKPP